MREAGHIYSPSSKRVTTSYDEELSVSQETMDYYNSLAKDGDSTPEMEEALEKAYVKAYVTAAGARWKGQERWQGRENIERRVVNILHPHDVMRKLQRAGVDARIEAPVCYVTMADDVTGRPVLVKKPRDAGRIWLGDEAVKGRIGIFGWVNDPVTETRRVKLLTSLQYPCGPEWTVMNFDQWNVPVSEKYRGWRTALLQMILKNIITEEEVDRAFGPVVLNPASELYRQQLQSHRAVRKGLVQ
jgi:hypothetical protein